ncbi:MAG: transglutaminase domain-containing protein [Candidatus Sumerlaeia bacterium]
MNKSLLPAVFFLLALLVQCLTMGYLVFFRLYPVIVFLIAFAGFLSPRKLELSRDNHVRLIFGLLIVFAFKAFVISKNDFANINAMVPYGYSYSLAQFCMLLQALYFFVKISDREFPSAMSLLGAIALMCLANQISGAMTHTVIRMASIAFVATIVPAIACLYAQRHQARQPRPLLLTAMVLLICALAYGGSLLATELEAFFTNTLLNLRFNNFEKSQAGFSNSPWLGSVRQWKTTDDNQIALKVFSRTAPGYMRGMTFDLIETQRHNVWKSRLQMENVSPQALDEIQLPGPEIQDNTFLLQAGTSIESLRKTPKGQWKRMQVKIMQSVADAVFTTFDSQIIEADIGFLKRNSSAIVQTVARPPGETYTLFANDQAIAEPLNESQQSRYLNTPLNLDPRIHDIATSACLGAKTNREKMESVSRYFRTNYQYHLGIVYQDAPKDRDLLNYFLIEKPPAHCEYFASGAAVLLRLQGVPCRYVSGFVVNEASPFNNFYLARNRDAHAWVEAWDDLTQRWFIVEATPSQGVPGSEPNEKTSLNAYWEELKTLIASFVRFFKWSNLKTNLQAILKSISRAIQSPVFLLKAIPIALLVAALIFYIKRRKRRAQYQDPAILAAIRLLQNMDARLAKHGLRRQSHETLSQFTKRINQSEQSPQFQNAINWYKTYARLRYSGKLDMQSLEELKNKYPQI